MILLDPFYQTQRGEIHSTSNCIQHEHALADLFTSLLRCLGYTSTCVNNRRWQRDDRTVVVCLVDDFRICSHNMRLPPAEWFDASTTVITDNHVCFPTQYQVLNVPVSYLGSFSYTPDNQTFDPDRRFNFPTNRIDTQRLLVLFELAHQSGGISNLLQLDYINFNCWDPCEHNNTVDDLKNNFTKAWKSLETHYPEYQCHYSDIVPLLPVRNHSHSIEKAHVSAHVNLVVETYGGDSVISFSEKTFRALVTPAPWTLCAAKGSVSCLKSLGFDILDDVVDHSYDAAETKALYGADKIAAFVAGSIDNANRIIKMDSVQLKNRCNAAASANQKLLANMRVQWPSDFAAWLPQVIARLE